MSQAGVKLTGAIEFTVKSDGSVDMKGTDADEAAVKAFLKADASQALPHASPPRRATRAVHHRPAKRRHGSGRIALRDTRRRDGAHASLMQQTSSTNVVFSLSPPPAPHLPWLANDRSLRVSGMPPRQPIRGQAPGTPWQQPLPARAHHHARVLGLAAAAVVAAEAIRTGRRFLCPESGAAGSRSRSAGCSACERAGRHRHRQ